MEDLQLHHYWRSSCSWRVRWALELKQIPALKTPVNLLQKLHQTPDYKANNPSGLVPCIVTGQHSYGESLAILEWLEEKHPTPPLLPRSAEGRMITRGLSYSIACGTQPLQNLSVQNYLKKDSYDGLEFAKHWIHQGLQTYEALLQHHQCAGKFSFQDQISMADLCLIPQVYNARRFNLDLSEFQKIETIYNSCLEERSCVRSSPEEQEGAF